ncbi:MAG: hypothetical protein FD167_6119, partial [bacterium]
MQVSESILKPPQITIHARAHSSNEDKRISTEMVIDKAKAMRTFIDSWLGKRLSKRKIEITGIRTNDLISGRYKVTRMIDSGGMANVYEVLDLISEKSFALKALIAKKHSEEVIRRFVREAR